MLILFSERHHDNAKLKKLNLWIDWVKGRKRFWSEIFMHIWEVNLFRKLSDRWTEFWFSLGIKNFPNKITKVMKASWGNVQIQEAFIPFAFMAKWRNVNG